MFDIDFILCCFYCYDDHRDRHVLTHSSPTRRSSDLGGFLVPANGSASLTPVGDHLMFMDLSAPLLPGAETDLTLIYDDGSCTTFTAQIRDFRSEEHTSELQSLMRI